MHVSYRPDSIQTYIYQGAYESGGSWIVFGHQSSMLVLKLIRYTQPRPSSESQSQAFEALQSFQWQVVCGSYLLFHFGYPFAKGVHDSCKKYNVHHCLNRLWQNGNRRTFSRRSLDILFLLRTVGLATFAEYNVSNYFIKKSLLLLFFCV